MIADSAARFLLVFVFSVCVTYAQNAPPIELNKPLKRELAGGQSHSYPLTLGAQQFLNFVVEQQGINVEVILLDPDQKQVVKANGSTNLRGGQEFVSFVATATGNYQVVVQTIDANAKPGAYELTVLALRPATTADVAIATAFKSYLEMLDFAAQKKTTEASAAQDQALAQLEQQFSQDASALNTMPMNVLNWYVGLLRNVGIRAQRKGDYVTAEARYNRALMLLETKFGKDTLDTILPINELAIVNYEKGDYATAATMMQRVLSIQQKNLPPNSFGIGASSMNLAAFLYKAGDYVQAEQLYGRAQAIWETLKHKNVLGARSGIAIIHLERGDYEQAEKIWLEVLKELEAEAKPSQDTQMLLAAVLGNMGGLYQQKNDIAKAESFWLRALTLRKEVFSPEHGEVAVALNRLGDVYLDKGETAKAEEYYSQGLALLKKTVGAEHTNVAYALNGLAKTAQKKRDYPKSASLFQDALQMRRKLTGENHPEVSETLGLLAQLAQETGDGKQALSYQAQANEINETNLRRNLSVGSERQKQAYLATFTKAINTTIGLHAWNLSDNQEAATTALTALLRNKGRGLDAMSDTVATFRRHADGEQLKLFDRLLAARAQLANLTFRGLGGDKPERYRAQLKQLESDIDALEADLSRRSAEFSSDARPITLPAIQAALPPKTTLIEFAAYQPYQFSKQTAAPTHYIAYVMNADGKIRWKDLGEAAAIDQSIEALRQALRDSLRTDVRQLARKVDEQVMQPLRPILTELADAPHLLISPDGLLNLLPFAALVDEQNRYLIERYAITYLTSGRDLLRLQVARANKSEPLILADPDFDLNPKAAPMALAKRGNNRRNATLHGVRASGGDFNKWNADRLFETAKEGEAIKALLPQSNLLVREKATKLALQQLNAPSILHVATHGFFLDDVKAVTITTRTATKSITHDDAAPPTIIDPLLRSGLILAGFNQHRTEGDNGVLTAKEAAGLNLWGTKLVVLSACDTGVGEVKNGEGVYGLRRALMLAGAQTQVMSLWPVSDSATREWMIEYYTGLQQGWGRSEAVRQVQLKLLQKKSRQHPFYWASFIPSGEWANLENKR
jgi:CHAT domain-containing protein